MSFKQLSIVSILATGLLVLHLGNAPDASAQVRPALVRSVDEPTRVAYQVTAAPTCPFGNECYISGPTVPAGKRLRITRLEGALVSQSTSIFAALHVNDTRHPVVMFPVPFFSGFFWGTISSFNQDVDYYFEAGQTPFLEIGCSASGTISADPRNTLSLVGYMTDTTP
jgi:hypothetical protein